MVRQSFGLRGLLLAVVLVVTACSGDDASPTTQATTAESTTTTVAVTTTTAAPTTTTTTAPTTTTSLETTTTTLADGEIPYPENTGDDYDKIVREISTFIGWLFENPDPALVDYLAVPGSRYHANFVAILQEYVDNGWRDLPGGRSMVVETNVIAELLPGQTVVVDVITDFDGATTVDEAGNVVKESPGRPRTLGSYTLENDPVFGWRIDQAVVVGEVDE